MKNKLISLFMIIFFVFTGCKFQLPEKVSVKTNAEYNFSLGRIYKDFDLQGFGSLTESTINGATLYDYYPDEEDSTVQKFLIDVPIQEIPLDFSTYFNKSDVALAIRELSFEKQINIPDIKKEISTILDSDYVNTAINAMLTVTGNPDTRTLYLFGSANFTAITYKTGKFDVSCNLPDGVIVRLNSNGVALEATFHAGQATFDIDGYTMKNDATLEFSEASTEVYLGCIRSGSVILNAEGVSATVDVPINNTLPLENSSSVLEEAIIGEGEILTEVKIPSTWTNVTCNYGIDITGALNVNAPTNSELTKSIDLQGKSIIPGNADFSSSFGLSFVDSYISFEKPFSISVTCDIKKFDSISIKASDIKTGLSRKDKFSEPMLKSIKRLMLLQSGIRGSYKNTLPSGNDINIIANSDFFGMENIHQSIEAGKDNEKIELLSPEDIHKLIYIKADPVEENEYKGWDFKLDIELPGSSTEHPDRITLYSVEAGGQYEIKLNFAPELNWEYIVLNGNTSRMSCELPLEISFDKLIDSIDSTLGVKLTDKFMLKELPLYVMVEKPEINDLGETGKTIFDDSRYKGDISLFYGTREGSSIIKSHDENGDVLEKKILGSELPNEGVLSFVTSPKREIKNNAVITNYTKCKHSIETDLIELINLPSVEGSELFIGYDLFFTNDDKADEIRITREMYELSDKIHTSIEIHGIIEIPLAFKVSNEHDVDLDFGELLNLTDDRDIFGRTGPSTDGVLSEKIGAIESFSVIYTADKIPIYSNPDITINLHLFEGENPSFKLKEGKITINSKNINQLVNTYPFCPSVDFHFIRGTEFSIGRKMAIDMNLQLKLKTNGVVSF